MLKVFRDNLKYLSWILWIVIAVFVLFVFADFGGRIPASNPSSAAATVGAQDVTLSELQRSYRNLERLQREIYGEQFTAELAQQLQLPLRALENLVNEKILLAEAERLGLSVRDEELRQAILDFPAFQRQDGSFVGDESYRNILRSNGFTVAEFEREQRTRLLLQKLTSVLEGNFFVPDEEAEETYRSEVERARIRYVALPLQRYRDRVELSDDQVETFFADHRDEFRLPERRKVAYLLVESSALRQTIDIPEEEVRLYYEEHRDEFLQPEEVRARHILLRTGDERSPEQAEEELRAVRRRIEMGEQFDALARELSEDAGTAERGGDLGYFRRGAMTRPFEEAAFSGAVGELVGPIRTDFGVHLLQVMDRRAEQQPTLDQVRSQIRFRLGQERLEELAPQKAAELYRRLTEQGVTGAEDLEALAREEPAASFGVTPAMSRFDPVAERGSWPGFNRAAFGLGEGELSEPVRVRDGWAILYLDKIEDPRIPELAEVKDKVREAAARERQLQLVLDELDGARQRLGEGSALEQVARELGIQVTESEDFGHDGFIPGLGNEPELAAEALSLAEGEVGGPILVGDKGVLFEVTAVTRWSREEFERQKSQIVAGLREEKLDSLLSALVAKRRRELEVSYNRELLESLGIQFQAPVS